MVLKHGNVAVRGADSKSSNFAAHLKNKRR